MDHLSVADFNTMLQSNVGMRLIDVRNPHELQEKGRFEQSTNIPFGEFESAIQLSDDEFNAKYNMEKPAKGDGNLVIHCQLGGRSNKAAVIAKAHGYACPKSLKGGYAAWKAFVESQ